MCVESDQRQLICKFKLLYKHIHVFQLIPHILPMACCNTKMAAKGHMMKNTHKERMHCYLIVVHILITGLETFSQLVYRNPDGSVKLV